MRGACTFTERAGEVRDGVRSARTNEVSQSQYLLEQLSRVLRPARRGGVRRGARGARHWLQGRHPVGLGELVEPGRVVRVQHAR